MKYVSWNIRHGGTKNKLNGICEQFKLWNPDVVGLTEFRESKTSQSIARQLSDLGLIHQSTTIDAAERGLNFLMLASRFPIERQPSSGRLADLGRWLHVKVQGMDVMLMHVPNRSPDKWQFHTEVISRFTELQDEPAIAFGDTNTGKPGLDEESKFFNRKEASWFTSIEESGWADVWRELNPEGREFTWYSNHGNGFRIDQMFATKSVAKSVESIRHDWGEGGREVRLSDHAAIVFEINEAFT